MSADGERRARVALSFLAKPGDLLLGAALRARTAAEVLVLVTGADADSAARRDDLVNLIMSVEFELPAET
jgi:hypothetical protein